MIFVMHIWYISTFWSQNGSPHFYFVDYELNLLKSGDIDTSKYIRSEQENKKET